LLIVGDSIALTLGRGLERWGPKHGISVTNAGRPECGIERGGLIDIGMHEQANDGVCTHWAELYAHATQGLRPNVVVVSSWVWDSMPHKLTGWREYEVPGMAEFDAWERAEFVHLVDVVSAHGARVVLLTAPCDEGTHIDAAKAAENQVFEQIAAARPAVAS